MSCYADFELGVMQDGATVSGKLTTPPPVGADGAGLDLFFCIFLRGAGQPARRLAAMCMPSVLFT